MAATTTTRNATATPRATTSALHAQSRKPRLRQARVAVIVGLLIFVGLATIAFAVVNGPQRDPEYDARLSRLRAQLAAASEKPTTVLMLGSSRTNNGFRSNSMNDCLTRTLGRPAAVGNFGLNGCSPSMHLVTWNRLRRDGVVPDLVLLEASPIFLSAGWGTKDLTEERLPLSRMRYCDLEIIEENFDTTRPGTRAEWLLALPNTLYDQRLVWQSRVAPAWVPAAHRVADVDANLPEDREIRPVDNSGDWRARQLKAQHDFLGSWINTYEPGPGYESLRKLLATLRRDGIPAALVVMPEGPTFQTWYGPGRLAKALRGIEELRTEFGVPLINAHNWFEELDFFDSHHLTLEASDRFTRRLTAEFVIPILEDVKR